SAWGGNWFFLVDALNLKPEPRLQLENCAALVSLARGMRTALASSGVTGGGGAQIDHIELFGRPSTGSADARNFVLCPGNACDRSPCGTGTSAKLACLYADGKLSAGEEWIQAGILDTVLRGSFKPGSNPGEIISTIAGTAHVTANVELLLDDDDPFCWGISRARIDVLY